MSPAPARKERFQLWRPEQSPIAVEYSERVLHDIRCIAEEAYQRSARGGQEIGGLLYGARRDKTIRILAARPIACEYAQGPLFVLSEVDREAVRAQLAAAGSDPVLAGLVVVGLYISHSRGDLAMTGSDQSLFEQICPERWQVTLILRPGRFTPTRAGFFVRDSSGLLHGEKTLLEFSIGLPKVEPPTSISARIPETVDSGAITRAFASAGTAPVPAPPKEVALDDGDLPTFLRGAEPVKPNLARRRLLLLTGWAAAVIMALGWIFRFASGGAPELPQADLGLRVVEQGGQLQANWNRSTASVAQASGGSMEIVDDGKTREVPLDQEQIRSGSFTYKPSSGDVLLRLTVNSPVKGTAREVAHYLGQAPKPGSDQQLQEAIRQRDDYAAQVRRLSREIEQRDAKVEAQARTIKILENRLNIDGGKPEPKTTPPKRARKK